MCGICGVFHSDRTERVNRDRLVAMNRQIVHRGPDDDGFFVDGQTGLAMRRLSIIDIQTGHQPLSNEDGSKASFLNIPKERIEASFPAHEEPEGVTISPDGKLAIVFFGPYAGRGKKRCQDPFSCESKSEGLAFSGSADCLRGRPRGRRVASNPSRWAARATQAADPTGRPR